MFFSAACARYEVPLPDGGGAARRRPSCESVQLLICIVYGVPGECGRFVMEETEVEGLALSE